MRSLLPSFWRGQAAQQDGRVPVGQVSGIRCSRYLEASPLVSASELAELAAWSKLRQAGRRNPASTELYVAMFSIITAHFEIQYFRVFLISLLQ